MDKWSPSCSDVLKRHDMKPYAVPSWKYGRRGTASSASGIVADAAAVQQSLRVPGTDVFLNYVSANAVGRQSTLSLYLVPDTVPKDLRLVKLAIDVEGLHFETSLEAKANLSYVFGWNKTNVYKQKVSSGLAAARVDVGYVYAGCERVFWERLNAKLSGHSGSISEIGGWNLNIHHRYNVLDSESFYYRIDHVLIFVLSRRSRKGRRQRGLSPRGPVRPGQRARQ